MNDWRNLVLPVLGLLATTALAWKGLLPPAAVYTFIVGVVLPAPGQGPLIPPAAARPLPTRLPE